MHKLAQLRAVYLFVGLTRRQYSNAQRPRQYMHLCESQLAEQGAFSGIHLLKGLNSGIIALLIIHIYLHKIIIALLPIRHQTIVASIVIRTLCCDGDINTCAMDPHCTSRKLDPCYCVTRALIIFLKANTTEYWFLLL